MPELVYKSAGHIELFRYRDSQSFYFNGVVSSIVPKITNNSKTLEDGNSDWDYEFTAGRQGEIAINLNSFQPKLYAAFVASSLEDKTSLAIRKIEEKTIPVTSPYEVTAGKTPTGNIVVVNQDDSPLVSVGSSPAQGQYSVADDKFTFNSSDGGTPIVIAYDFTAANAGQMEMASQSNNDIFRLTVTGQGVEKDNEAVGYCDAITFDRVMPIGEISMPPRQKEPAGWSVNMKVQKPRQGYPVVDYRIEK